MPPSRTPTTDPDRRDPSGEHAEGPAPVALPWRRGISVLAGYARPHVGAIAVGILLALLATATSLVTPLVTKQVLDSVGTGADLTVPALALVGLLLAGTAAAFTQEVVLGRMAENVVLEARRALVSRFFRAPLLRVQEFRTGELVTRVTSDTVLLREAVSGTVVKLVNATVGLVGAVVLMAVLDWPLLLTTLASLAVIGILVAVLLPRIGVADKRTQDALGDVGSTLETGIRALRTVKAAGVEDRQIARLDETLREATRHSIRSISYMAATGAVAGGGVQLATLVILGLGAWRVGAGELAVSTLVAFLLYAFYVVQPIGELVAAFSALQSGQAAVARITETERLVPEDLDVGLPAPPARTPQRDVPVLALRDVTVAYPGGQAPVLHNVTIEIPRTGHVALVGPSGAGKTTVFSLLLRFLEPSAGRVELDGTAYDELSLRSVRSRMSYVEQETPVLHGTIRENVAFRSPDVDDDVVWEALRSVRLADTVAALPAGLATQVSEATLSGGQRQRLAVARALVDPPDILLLDEATAQLDGATEAALQTVIERAATTGVVLTIAHRLSTVIDADRIVLLDAGRVRDTGTHAELLARDVMYREFVHALRIGTEPDPAGESI